MGPIRILQYLVVASYSAHSAFSDLNTMRKCLRMILILKRLNLQKKIIFFWHFLFYSQLQLPILPKGAIHHLHPDPDQTILHHVQNFPSNHQFIPHHNDPIHKYRHGRLQVHCLRPRKS